MKKKVKKITCKNCLGSCCDNVVLTRCKGNINDPEPDDLPKGSLIYVEGMWWKKKANGRWVCNAYDRIRAECKIYDNRPPICRWFKCPSAKKSGKKPKMPANNYNLRVTNYRIHLFVKKGEEHKCL